ncbi:hypothetical protein [Clostridium thailandense]|uniref:hypothetical protein n=1 Tax=Clostridium thailandense TaxID=2794346 RepID=UPI003988BF3E
MNWIKVDGSIEPRDEEFALLVSINLEAASFSDISKFMNKEDSNPKGNFDNNYTNQPVPKTNTNGGCGCLILIIITFIIIGFMIK